MRAALWAALAVLAAGLLMRLTWYGFVPWPAPFGEDAWIEGKENLALPRLLHALALAFVVAALVPRDAPWMHRAVPRAVARIGQVQPGGVLPGPVSLVGRFRRVSPSAGCKGWRSRLQDTVLIGLGGLALAWFAALLDRRRAARRIMAAA